MNKSPENIAQLIIAAALTLAGIGLLYLGTLLAPQGEIHESILVAFGEVATFAGAIIGIDYRYKRKTTETQSPFTNNQSPGASYRLTEEVRDRSAEEGFPPFTNNQSPITNDNRNIEPPEQDRQSR